MNQIQFSWPDGKAGAFTTSWDDGTIYDRRLVEILNQAGIKGTWNLNSGKLGLSAEESKWHGLIAPEEVPELYAGHEVAAHTVNHPFLQREPSDIILSQVIEDRRTLEALTGYPVRGMALPYGTTSERVQQILKAAGIVHCRPTTKHNSFSLPADFMNWTTTCHHKADLMALWDSFLAAPHSDKLMYVWGHSYEFHNDDNWEHIEKFAQHAGGHEACWYATNMEIYDYVTAWRSLCCSVEVTSIQNKNAVRLWFRFNGTLHSIDAGDTIKL